MKEERNIFLRGLSRIVFGGIALYWCLNNMSVMHGILQLVLGLLFPFLLGGAIAFLLNILLRFVERIVKKGIKSEQRKGLVRTLSILTTLILVVLVILCVTLIVVPQIATTIGSIRIQIPEFVNSVKLAEVNLSQGVPELTAFLNQVGLTWENISQVVTGFISSFGGKALNLSISFATTVFSSIVNFFLALVFAIYILAGKERLGEQFFLMVEAYFPQKILSKTHDVVHLVDQIFTAFFTGQCLEACILGTMFFIAMNILRFPYALLISVAIGFTALVPIFGAFIGCVIGTFLILVVNPMQAVWFVVFFLVMQQIENNLVYPRVVGGSVGLPAIWVLVAVTLGGSLFGVMGMLVFIPLISVLYALLNKDVSARVALKRQKATPAPEQNSN